MKNKALQIAQLNTKLKVFEPENVNIVPSVGWINAIRTTLGMSLEQLGKKLMITKQSMKEIEQREINGSITINRMKEVAEAIEMKFIYGFFPKDGSIEALIDRKSMEAARKVVTLTFQNMKLEDQEVSEERIEMAVKERAKELKNELSKLLWS